MTPEGISLGEKIKRRRETMGYSLRKLSKLTGLSASFLSQVELNKTNISLSSLQTVSAALEVPLLFFLENKIPPMPVRKEDENATGLTELEDRVITKEARTSLMIKKSGVEYELLVPGMGHKMVAFERRLSPGHEHPIRRVLKERTEELVYVLSGKLLVELTTGQYTLNPEDTIYFEGHEILRFECASQDEDAVWITVITPSIL